MGRRLLVQSLTASERTSIQLFMTQANGTWGQAMDQRMYLPKLSLEKTKGQHLNDNFFIISLHKYRTLVSQGLVVPSPDMVVPHLNQMQKWYHQRYGLFFMPPGFFFLIM